MKERIAMTVALLLGGASLLLAHDLFIKLDNYFLEPHARVSIPVLNGTFSASENSVAPERLLDLSVVSPHGRKQMDTGAWSANGDSSFISLETGESGTYLVGVSIRTNEITLTGEQFNEYLEHDGIPDVLEMRKQNDEMEKGATERYSKHVKAIFQIGSERTDGFGTTLGYPAEIVPLENPYALTVGGELRVRCLVDGKPVANQPVIAGGEHYGVAMEERMVRTDADGIAQFVLDSPGKWYVKFINMVPVSVPDLDYESKWATLTFEMR